eukprot:scaffold2.g6957.t1
MFGATQTLKATTAPRTVTCAAAKVAKKAGGTERSGGAGYRVYKGDALWLPNTARPAWLDGSLPGDRGFDPLGLARPSEYLQVDIDSLDQNKALNKPGAIVGSFTPVVDQVTPDALAPYSEVFGLQRFRENEVFHGRWAMLACLGCLVQEASVPGLTWSAAQTAEYANPSYLGVELPFSIYQLAWANSILMGGAEIIRNFELDPEKRVYPGGAFDPLKLASDDSERTFKLREAEVKHGRLAMISFLGFAVQAWFTGEGVLGSLQKFSNGF